MKYLVLLIALITVNASIAQTDSTSTDELRTLFSKKSGKTKVSGFGSVNLDFGNIENSFGLMLGGEGAVLLNKRFYIGFYGRGLTTMPNYAFDHSFKNRLNIEQRGVLGHGGLLLGYIFNPNSPIHFGISTRIGGGAIGLVYYYNDFNQDPNLYYPDELHKSVFTFAPEANIEMNLTNWFKIKLGVGYQYISEASIEAPIIEDGKFVLENGEFVTEELINSKNYNTPTVTLGFVFGWFK